VNKSVRTNPSADDEIFHYVAQYDATSREIGEKLFREIRDSFELLSRYPRAGEVVPRVRLRGAARRIPLRHFPFFIIYRDLSDHVEIMALAHTARRPNYWRSRFK
jgi:plasmid stabilization system protein ParE